MEFETRRIPIRDVFSYQLPDNGSEVHKHWQVVSYGTAEGDWLVRAGYRLVIGWSFRFVHR